MVWDIFRKIRISGDSSDGRLVENVKKTLTAVKILPAIRALHFLGTIFVWYSRTPGMPRDLKNVSVELKDLVGMIIKIDFIAPGGFIPYIFFLIPAFFPKNQLKTAIAKAMIASVIEGSNSNILSSFGD